MDTKRYVDLHMSTQFHLNLCFSNNIVIQIKFGPLAVSFEM